MKTYKRLFNDVIIGGLQSGEIAVIKTDTLYGIVCKADSESSVERIYKLKQRAPNKSPIVLIGDTTQMFETPADHVKDFLGSIWPGPVSVIIDTLDAPSWITRGNQSVAYRLPANYELQELLKQTGPLIAPSANPEGHAPAMTIAEAKDYFGNEVDIYVDGGEVLSSSPSSLVRINQDGSIEKLR